MSNESDYSLSHEMWLGPYDDSGYRTFGLIEVNSTAQTVILQVPSGEIQTNQSNSSDGPFGWVHLTESQLTDSLTQIADAVASNKSQGLFSLCHDRLQITWTLCSSSDTSHQALLEEFCPCPVPDFIVEWTALPTIPDPDFKLDASLVEHLPKRFGMRKNTFIFDGKGMRPGNTGYAAHRLEKIRWTASSAARLGALALEVERRGLGAESALTVAQLSAASTGDFMRYLDAASAGLRAGEEAAELVMPMPSGPLFFEPRRRALVQAVMGLAVGWEFYTELESQEVTSLIGIGEAALNRRALMALDENGNLRNHYRRLIRTRPEVVAGLGRTADASPGPTLLDHPLKCAHRAMAALQLTDLRLSSHLGDLVDDLVAGDSGRRRTIEHALIATSARYFLPETEADILRPSGLPDDIWTAFSDTDSE